MAFALGQKAAEVIAHLVILLILKEEIKEWETLLLNSVVELSMVKILKLW